MQIKKTGLILFTENYPACVHFYRDLLGLEVIFEQEKLVCLEFGGAYLMVEMGGIANPEGKSRAENPTVIRFNLAEVEATAEELRAKGVAVSVEQHPWGTIGVFYDPDGNRGELRNAWD